MNERVCLWFGKPVSGCKSLTTQSKFGKEWMIAVLFYDNHDRLLVDQKEDGSQFLDLLQILDCMFHETESFQLRRLDDADERCDGQQDQDDKTQVTLFHFDSKTTNPSNCCSFFFSYLFAG